MQFADIETREQLRDFMTSPTDALVQFVAGLEGDLLVLGAGGKMGVELVETVLRADRLAGVRREVGAVSRFSQAAVRARLEKAGARIHRGDLTDRVFLQGLPDAPHVIFMAGFKFGTSQDWRGAFHLNCIMPYLVGERFAGSNIVVYSSGNPYPATRPEADGCKESDQLAPQGVYGWGIVARESAFATTAHRRAAQKLCFFRLMYAQHLAYGVLVDLARMVWNQEPISLAVPAVNLVSQRDAIDVSLRALGHCTSPAFILNCAGPAVEVRRIAGRLGELMGKAPTLLDDDGEAACLADDGLALSTFGPYRDRVDEMIEAAAGWVMAGGEYWDKPTMFGRADHEY